MGRLLRAGRRVGRSVGRWVVEGLANDHTWCWGYVLVCPPPQRWRGAPERPEGGAQNSSRSSRSRPRNAS